jgi:hypothetical protein
MLALHKNKRKLASTEVTKVPKYTTTRGSRSKNLTWNISQSGMKISPNKMLLNDTEAMCRVCSVGSRGMKSSEALATALFKALQNNQELYQILST